jgi:hypothetical protein
MEVLRRFMIWCLVPLAVSSSVSAQDTTDLATCTAIDCYERAIERYELTRKANEELRTRLDASERQREDCRKEIASIKSGHDKTVAGLQRELQECRGAENATWRHFTVNADRSPNFQAQVETFLRSVGPRLGGIQAGLSLGQDFHIFAREDRAGTDWKLVAISTNSPWLTTVTQGLQRGEIVLVGFNQGNPISLWYLKLER